MAGNPAAFSEGQLLAQLRPSVTTAVQAYKVAVAPQGLRTEITLIKAPVLTGSAVISLYHDDSGNDVYDATTLICEITRSAAPASPLDTILFQAQSVGSGIFVKPGGSLAVQVSVANEANFSIYGITETLAAERVRPR